MFNICYDLHCPPMRCVRAQFTTTTDELPTSGRPEGARTTCPNSRSPQKAAGPSTTPASAPRRCPYKDSYDPEFWQQEIDTIFKKEWLNVGRVEQLPRVGSYFTKEFAWAKRSIIVVKDKDGTVRAFHNVCRHRGNKLVWDDYPQEETSGTCRQFTCKYHAWRYDLDGSLNFVQQESEFFDLDKENLGLVPVACDVWEGLHLRQPRRRAGPDAHRGAATRSARVSPATRSVR